MISDLITHFDTNWNIVATPKPDFLSHKKQVLVKGSVALEGLNYVRFLDLGAKLIEATMTGSQRDEIYNIMITISSADSEAKRDLMVDEVKRISHVTVAGTYYGHLTSLRNNDDSERWTTLMYYKLYKFLVNK